MMDLINHEVDGMSSSQVEKAVWLDRSQLIGVLLGAVLTALIGVGGWAYTNAFDKIDAFVEKRPNLLSLPPDLRGQLRVVSHDKELSSISVAQVHLLNRASIQRDLGPVTIRFAFKQPNGGAPVQPLLSKLVAPGLQGQDGIKELRHQEQPDRVDFEVKNFKATDIDQKYVAFFLFEGDQVPDIDADIVQGSNMRVVSYRWYRDATWPLTFFFVFLILVFVVMLVIDARNRRRQLEKDLKSFHERLETELSDQSQELRQRIYVLFQRHRQPKVAKTNPNAT